MGYRLHIIGQVDASAISGLSEGKAAFEISRPFFKMYTCGRTSGDSSSRINAPLVSTCMDFAVGSDGIVDMSYGQGWKYVGATQICRSA